MSGSGFQTVSATPGQRAGGYLLDLIPPMLVVLPLQLLHFIPVVGTFLASFLAGIVLFPYWLLRDVTGASPGKHFLGLRVAAKDGGAATTGSRILRNLPLAVGPALLLIPVLGAFMAPVVAIPLVLTETILVLSKNERLGDKIAGTVVVKK